MYLSIILIIFSILIGFVNGLHVFPVDYQLGPQNSGTTESTFMSSIGTITGLGGSLAALWVFCMGAGAIASGGLSILTQSWTPFAIYLFTSIFWTSFIKASSVFSMFIPAGFLLAITVGITFIFIGAIIKILGSSA
jgi:hypothetical protein